MTMWRRLAPFAGFGIGWLGMTTATTSDLIDQKYLVPLFRVSLNAQLKMWQLAPASMCQALLAPEDEITHALKYLEPAAATQEAPDQRRTFGEILKECGLQEQMDWLQDHVLEEIPFFYIGDLFHCWASLHESVITEGRGSIKKEEQEVLRNELLTRKVLEKVQLGVIPYDVGVRALCILAVGNDANAKTLAREADASKLLLAQCAEYATKRSAENSPPVNSDRLVAQSTILLLAQINKALARRPLFGLLKGDECPVGAQCQKEWCDVKDWLMAACDEKTNEGFPALISRHVKC